MTTFKRFDIAVTMHFVCAVAVFYISSTSGYNTDARNLTNFEKQVLPSLTKLFASNDRAIRVGLLQHMDQFGSALSPQVADEQV